jgi:hypothetical protein
VMSTLAQSVPLAELVIASGDGPGALAGIVRDWGEGLP